MATGTIPKNLAADVDTLNSNTGVQEITLQNATAGGNASFYYKIGHMVTCFLDLTPNSSGATLTVCTLPSGCTPPVSLRYTLSPVNHTSTDLGTCYVQVVTDGRINIYMSTAARVFVTMCFAV